MTTDASTLHLFSTIIGLMFVALVILILFFEFRDLILSKRITATVIRIEESPSTDADGHERIDRSPEIQFIDPSGALVTHKLLLTNITKKKPGDKMSVFYRSVKSKTGYKISSPFMWPKVILLLLLSVGALLLLLGTD